MTLTTDSDGRALVRVTLGPEEGIDNNVVEATFADNSGLPATFVASGKLAGDPAATQISGVVLDNSDIPIAGVFVWVSGTTLSAQTDAQGQFVVSHAPVGSVRLVVDGSTAQRPGSWPHVAYDLVTIAGYNNTVGMPIHLLPLDIAHGLTIDEAHGGTLTLPDVPGFALTIAPGSATFLNGGHSGLVSVTVVHADKTPMTPNFGQQPRFIVTIQPSGVLFDPPAPLTIPNVDGLTPGEITEMYSFDHDLGQFVSIGFGTVSEDGSVLKSNAGVGVIKGGWHCGGNPATTGSCDDCGSCGGCPCAGGRCAAPPVCPPCTTLVDCKCVSSCGPCEACLPGGPNNSGPLACRSACGDCAICQDDHCVATPKRPCDDQKKCTSSDGVTPGQDRCDNNMVCLGTQIPDDEALNMAVNVDLSALSNVISDALNPVKSVLPCSVGNFGLFVNASTFDVTHCCTQDASIVHGEREIGTGGVTLGTISCAVPGLFWTVPSVFEAGLKASIGMTASAGLEVTTFGACPRDHKECVSVTGSKITGGVGLEGAFTPLGMNVFNVAISGETQISLAGDCCDGHGQASGDWGGLEATADVRVFDKTIKIQTYKKELLPTKHYGPASFSCPTGLLP